MIPDRKPLTRMESKDERLSFRVTSSQAEILRAAAFAEGEELSRYIRACLFMGHTMKETQKRVQGTGA